VRRAPKPHAMFQQKCSGTDDRFLPVHKAENTLAGCVGEFLWVHQCDTYFIGRLQNGAGRGMLGETLSARGPP
jgi:hypothetical protein